MEHANTTHSVRSRSVEPVTVIGGGLAGSEAAWQLAERGIPVTLFEMRPGKQSPAHHSGSLAELVCSNSFKSDDPITAAGELKRELEYLGSMLLQVARICAVPAGGALAVDREVFARTVTEHIENHPLVDVVRREMRELPEGRVIIATGPLSSDGIEPVLGNLVGAARLAFFDAAAPIVEASSIDRELAFSASRYGKGGSDDYINCPMDREQYDRFIAELLTARRVHSKDFERRELFSACQPVEEIARSGHDALRFGPLKPVGLTDPRTANRPWAVVQLRAENLSCTAYNLVGFQTNLAFSEQERVFRLIPGLEHAEFARLGVMHRNTFIDSPRLLDASLRLRSLPRVRVAGQLAGTEGYLEAVGSGLLAGLGAAAEIMGMEPFVMPELSAFGALMAYATSPLTSGYQPMHVNWGIIEPLPQRVKGKRERYAAYAQRALQATGEAIATHPMTAGSRTAAGSLDPMSSGVDSSNPGSR
ncbi:MAG: methylenetetrahydrofolate--tRNA-(uracil(54)-C(5))-methyltransferase (FADH(2)-oxidizing) TrmFO [Actinobacteria bacterium]|nr:methylenetetrahydrofolate--tRNA-(uracil(54)-C(5))-methyltransferase (FADH(2)-oxidizing) TrmFO [Actinomycetota bacterium]MCG2807791.1 methylenetetrahydrofolate--tRNA-(uracil(54)-C(5))-methyltransferase (FADH(2)-oxidizing) TrmFO [Coriobacteriia bacterium]